LRVVQRDAPERILPLASKPITIGRRDGHTITPNCDRVSRDHAKFSIGEAGPHVEDLGSRNGIRVNGAKVAAADLLPSDVVKVGSLRIYVEEISTEL
jgi:pSer/pThr/pTyr-binding forkhead associated (FHA) protein